MATRTNQEGDCYEAAIKYALEILQSKNKKLIKCYKLCHGEVLGKVGEVKGLWFGHAWIEMNEQVLIDPSNNKTIITRIELLQDRIRKVRRYGLKQAANLCLKHETYGPWE
jgi:hypothetical protein